MKTKLYAFLLLLTFGGGAHAATLSDTVQAAVLSKQIIAAYTVEDYTKTQKLFMEYDRLDATMPPPLMLVRVRSHYNVGEFIAAYQRLVDYLNTTPPDSPGYDAALEMYVALEAKPEVARAKAKFEAKDEAKLEAEIATFVEEKGHQPSLTVRGDDPTDLYLAVQMDLLEVAALLIEKGEDVNVKDNRGRTLLHIAVGGDKVEVAALLIEKGADVNVKDNRGRTLLHIAVGGDKVEVAALLIEKGADVNVKDNRGRTPLHRVARGDKVEVAAWLIEKGATVNVKDNFNATPLHSAARVDAVKVAALLIEKGATVNVKDDFNATPLKMAVARDAHETAALLRQHGGYE